MVRIWLTSAWKIKNSSHFGVRVFSITAVYFVWDPFVGVDAPTIISAKGSLVPPKSAATRFLPSIISTRNKPLLGLKQAFKI